MFGLALRPRPAPLFLWARALSSTIPTRIAATPSTLAPAPAAAEKAEPLLGSLAPYNTHLFICSGKASWPKNIASTDNFVAFLTKTIPNGLKLTACDEETKGNPAPGDKDPVAYDLLLFPHGLRILGATEEQIPKVLTLAEEITADQSTKPPVPGLFKNLKDGTTKTVPELKAAWGLALELIDPRSKHFFVCSHKERDERCGNIGPKLVEKLKGMVTNNPLIKVYKTSHVGGHVYAGNVIVHPPGDCYGLVNESNVGSVYTEAKDGRVLPALWRGRMGLTTEQQKGFFTQGIDDKHICITYVDKTGREIPVQATIGERVVTTSWEYKIEAGGDCGGNMECGSCHVHVDPAFTAKLPPQSQGEKELLSMVGQDVRENSRLGCQIVLTKELNGLKVVVPK